MNYRGAITADIERMLVLFSAHCVDRDTIDELIEVVRDPSTWRKAHNLFQKIRKKTLTANSSKNMEIEAQYLFEEICAKVLYNLSGDPAPFDADSPYWLVPNAIAFGRHAGVSESEVLACVSMQVE
jgi:hypothetical protein